MGGGGPLSSSLHSARGSYKYFHSAYFLPELHLDSAGSYQGQAVDRLGSGFFHPCPLVTCGVELVVPDLLELSVPYL